MSFKRKLPWTRQPQQSAGIDRSNPLGKTVTHCIPFNGENRDIVTGTALTLGSASGQGVDVRGRHVSSTGVAACASIPLNLSAYTKISVSFWLYWDVFADNDALAMEYTPNYGAAGNAGFIIDPNSSSLAFDVGVAGEGAYNTLKFTRPSAAAWRHYVINFDRTTGAAASSVAYVDGVLQSVSASTTLQDVVDNFTNSTLYIFSRNNAALFGAGRMQNLVIRGQHLMSASEAKAEYDNPWQIFEKGQRKIYVDVATAAQNLSPGLYSDADTFYAPVVSHGLTAGLFTDSDTFYAPTVAPGSVALSPGLYADADTFYAATVSLDGSPQTLTPALYADADTFYAATVTPGAVNLAPGIYTDADTFYAATVAASYNLQPATFADADTFYAPTVSGGQTVISPGLFIDPDIFYSATVASPTFLSSRRQAYDNAQTSRRSNKQTARRP